MNLRKKLTISFLAAALLIGNHSYAADSPTIPDSEITTQVKNKIYSDPSFANFPIKISTTNGVVSISGNFSSADQASTAIEQAQSVPGVKDVDTSQVVVNHAMGSVNDAFITAKIKGAFIQEKLFGASDIPALRIKVETNDGIVTLSGSVSNMQQADKAKAIATSVSGVKSVNSNITIDMAK